jgi:hypothetical protein
VIVGVRLTFEANREFLTGARRGRFRLIAITFGISTFSFGFPCDGRLGA